MIIIVLIKNIDKKIIYMTKKNYLYTFQTK